MLWLEKLNREKKVIVMKEKEKINIMINLVFFLKILCTFCLKITGVWNKKINMLKTILSNSLRPRWNKVFIYLLIYLTYRLYIYIIIDQMYASIQL